MTMYYWYIFLNHSILFPVAAGIIRLGSLGRDYLLFVLLIWAGAVNDSLSLYLSFSKGNNALNGNLYVLVEYVCILQIFRVWNGNGAGRYIIWAGVGLFVWVLDNFMLHTIRDNNSIFRIFYSVVVIFYSVDRFNNLIISEKGQLVTNTQFLICIAFLVYYFCKCFAEILNAYAVPFDAMFYKRLWLGLAVVNFLANITYGIAILCIPKKKEFTLHY